MNLSTLAPTLSFIVPVYNVLPYLRTCVESIRSQAYTDYELILVDDGSTDGSGALCDELAQTDPRIRVVHQPNGGLSAARNKGLDLARGKYLWFVDSDDSIAPQSLGKVMEAITTDQSELLCFSFQRANGTETWGRPVGAYHPGIHPGQAVIEKRLTGNLSACTHVSLRSIWVEHGLRFLEGICFEDLELWPRLFRVVQKVSFLPQNILPYRYNIRPSSIMRQADPERKLRQVEDFFRIEASWNSCFNLTNPTLGSFDQAVAQEATRRLHRGLLAFTLHAPLPLRTKLQLFRRYKRQGVFAVRYHQTLRNPYAEAHPLLRGLLVVGRSYPIYAAYMVLREGWKKLRGK